MFEMIIERYEKFVRDRRIIKRENPWRVAIACVLSTSDDEGTSTC